MFLNKNGEVIPLDLAGITSENRAFKYGDAVFDTLKYTPEGIEFIEDHYFRLMSSLRMLRMKIPMDFTLSFYEEEILKLIEAHKLEEQVARIRVTVSRKGGGLYTPNTNEIDYFIEAKPLNLLNNTENYTIELFKDYPIHQNILSTLKTTNRIVNVLASIYAKENEYDNCLLINDTKHIVEAINGNVFLVKDNTVITPPLTEGCVQGIIRKNMIQSLKKSSVYQLEERKISPFELLKADEVFITNSIIGVHSVKIYRKKVYNTEVGQKMALSLRELATSLN